MQYHPDLPPEQFLPVREPDKPLPGPETAPVQDQGGQERRHDLLMEHPPPPTNSGIAPPPPVVTPTVPPPAGSLSSPPAAVPAAAANLDVIEREWVNRIMQIIRDTQGDPYAQEAAFEQAQIEYLEKQHGKQIRATRG